MFCMLLLHMFKHMNICCDCMSCDLCVFCQASIYTTFIGHNLLGIKLALITQGI